MCISGAVFYWHSGVDHGLDLFIVGFISECQYIIEFLPSGEILYLLTINC